MSESVFAKAQECLDKEAFVYWLCFAYGYMMSRLRELDPKSAEHALLELERAVEYFSVGQTKNSGSVSTGTALKED